MIFFHILIIVFELVIDCFCNRGCHFNVKTSFSKHIYE